MDTVRETTVKEAATVLGLSPEGVRKRLQRGTLSGRKAGTSWTVFLPAGPRMQDTSTGDVQDVGQDAGLLAHLQGEIAYLREELQRKDAIIMQMAQKPLLLPAPEPERVATGGGAAAVVAVLETKLTRFAKVIMRGMQGLQGLQGPIDLAPYQSSILVAVERGKARTV